MASEAEVWILSPVPGGLAVDSSQGSAQSIVFRNRVDLQVFSRSLQEFSTSIGQALGKVEKLSQEFILDEVEISAVAGADGTLTLLGGELSGKLEGSVKLVFRRQKP